MKWYSSKKFHPGQTGDQIILRLKSGYIHAEIFDDNEYNGFPRDGRYRRNGDPLTCYRRPRKSEYVALDNITKDKRTYSRADDAEVLRETFSDVYDRYDRKHDAI